MLSILSAIGALLAGPLTSIVSSVTGLISNDKTIQGNEFAAMTAAERDEFIAIVQAETNLNAAKSANNWWGAHVMVLIFGIPPALHMGAVYIDAAFFHGGHIKSVPPEYADAEFKIALSFFLLAPVLSFGSPIFSSLSKRLGK